MQERTNTSVGAQQCRHTRACRGNHTGKATASLTVLGTSSLQRLVKHLGQHRQDGLKISAFGDELQGHKVLGGQEGEAQLMVDDSIASDA